MRIDAAYANLMLMLRVGSYDHMHDVRRPSAQAKAAFPVVLFTNSPFMGGMEEHIMVLGRGLVERGFQVAAICSTTREIQPLRQSLASAGVRVHPLPERQSGRFGIARRLASLTATLRQYPGCVVHLHLTGHTGGDLVQAAARLSGARAIVRTEHLPPMPPISARERLGVHLRDRFLSRVIYVSSQTRLDHIERLGRDGDKCAVVPNCVDVTWFSPTTPATDVYAEFGLDPLSPIVGTISRMAEHRKGLNYFVDMARTVAVVHPETRFLLVGDGPLRAELERKAHALGIGDRVVFTGTREDAPRLLAAMTVFVMPSLYEGGPITVLEAMATGKPVVATPVGMVPDLIQDGVTGVLARPADSADLTRAVLRLLADPALARDLGERGRSIVVSRFSPEAMVDGVADVYRQVA